MKDAGKLALLGPEGTYSHFAAKKYLSTHKGYHPKLLFCGSIAEAIHAVSSGKSQEAVLPFENSIQGTVLETLDGIFDKKLIVHEELVVDIHHSVASLHKKIKRADIQRVFSHPQALAQCKRYIERHFPNASVVATGSTAGAQKKIKDEQLADAVAIGPAFGAKLSGLHVQAQNIEDEENNQTMFVAVSPAKLSQRISASRMKGTLLALVPKTDKPGLLHDILSAFKMRNINLSKIESRPARTKLGAYIFYVKIDISYSNKNLKSLLEELKLLDVGVSILSR